MLRFVEHEARSAVSRLFRELDFGCVANSILEGHMGKILSDDPRKPMVGVLEARNELFAILVVTGDAAHLYARQYVEQLPTNSEI